MKGDTVLEVKNLNKRFPGVQALEDVDFNLKEGEVHALVGENGAGKSTFLKILSGNLDADSGEVYYKGDQYKAKNTQEARDKGISMAYQELSLVPSLTVAENIFLGDYDYKAKNKLITFIDWDHTRQRAKELMELYNLDIDVTKRVKELGVGQQQLVEIIRAVAKDVNILMLDEPTSALSQEEIDILFNNIISEMKERGVSVIYISHRLGEAFQIADRVTVFRDGEKIKTMDIKETDRDEIVSLMVGREIDDRYIKPEGDIKETCLEVKNLTAAGLIENCSLNVKRGEIVGLSGLMGAGRTEFAKTLIGLIDKDSGIIKIDGEEIEIETPNDALNAGIAYLAENRSESLVYPLTVSQNITLANLKYIFENGILHKKREKTAGEKYVKYLDIDTPSIRQKVKYLSGGNQQKVALARWIYSNVEVFILDEPTRGIDVGAKVEVYHLIEELLKDNKGVLLISSELPEIVSLSDRVYVMQAGNIVAEYQGDQITQENIMHSATGGTTNG